MSRSMHALHMREGVKFGDKESHFLSRHYSNNRILWLEIVFTVDIFDVINLVTIKVGNFYCSKSVKTGKIDLPYHQ